MIQSEHTGAIDVLSADLESADLLGDHRKGEAFGSRENSFFMASRCLKDSSQKEGKKTSWWEPLERMLCVNLAKCWARGVSQASQ